MICGEWVATIIWMPLMRQMSEKYVDSFCCQETCRDISGSSMIARVPGGQWNSRL